jgi:transposase
VVSIRWVGIRNGLSNNRTASDFTRARLNRPSRLGCSTATEETVNYLGIDVHTATTVFCLLDEQGEIVAQGNVPTTNEGFLVLLGRCGAPSDLLAGQEVGKMACFVHDAFAALGVRLLSFNAYHLRMIASSRKKTDKRDAYWIAKALQTGMTPHPVYIPTGQIRQLRRLVARRTAVLRERRGWLLRARSYLEAEGFKIPRAHRTVSTLILAAVNNPRGLDAELYEALMLCQRMDEVFALEQKRLEKTLFEQAGAIDAVQRLMTIPGIGIKVATMIYAWVGDVRRFPDARSLASYAGLVPSVHQSGKTCVTGRITKQGSSQLRSVLTQAAHVLMWRCQNEASQPLKEIAQRVHTSRGRRKIAVVAGARHLLRIAYYVLRDGTTYDPSRLHSRAPLAPTALVTEEGVDQAA